jgi:hypothetical protein
MLGADIFLFMQRKIMKKINFIILITLLCYPTILISQPVKGKWGVSASLSPWTHNREITISKNLSESWSILIWGDFTFEKDNSRDYEYYHIEDGHKYLIGPEIRKKLYYLEKYKIAPYFGFLIHSGYEKYDKKFLNISGDKQSQRAVEAGIELTFGVEYFVSEHISFYIHNRFIKYQYYWIDLEQSIRGLTKQFKTRYHLLSAGNLIPALFICFYF